MPKHLPTIEELIAAARERSEALGDLLEEYRGFLRIIADQEIGQLLGRRVDPSDVVQQTFLKAQRGFKHFEGSAEPELSAWLKQILHNNIKGLVRDHVYAQKRAVEREQPLNRANDSAVLFWHEPVGNQSTPSQQAVRGEQAIRLARILHDLPENQRRAVELRFLQGQRLDKIAEDLDCTYAAAAGLVKRGLGTLRRMMAEESWS